MPEPSQKLKFGYESSGEIVGSGRLSRFFILLEPGEIQSIRLIGKQGEDGPAVVLKTLYLELKVQLQRLGHMQTAEGNFSHQVHLGFIVEFGIKH